MFVSTLPARPTVTVSLEAETLLSVTVQIFANPNRTIKYLKRFTKRGKQISTFRLLYPPQTKFGGYMVILMSVRYFVRSSVRPSQSLIRYSSKTAEQNFMKLSGIVHYMMPYCTSYFKFLFRWFWGFPEQNKDFAIQNMEAGGIILWALLTVFLVLYFFKILFSMYIQQINELVSWIHLHFTCVRWNIWQEPLIKLSFFYRMLYSRGKLWHECVM